MKQNIFQQASRKQIKPKLFVHAWTTFFVMNVISNKNNNDCDLESHSMKGRFKT